MGDRLHPLTAGYTCPAGRELPAQHLHPERLRHSLKRRPDGTFERIDSEQAMDEIALRMREVLDAHGPRALAFAPGTGIGRVPTAMPFGMALWEALGSPMVFTPATIDQPGKVVASSLHGRWGGHIHPFREADTWLLIGTNPVVSMWAGGFWHDPAGSLRAARRRGMQLVVIDPRATETAAFADVHLRPRPGEDATLLAGLVRELLANGWHDAAFCASSVTGVEGLRRAVEPFTPDYVAWRTGVPPGDVERVARLLGRARVAGVNAGTGADMGPRGPLVEYLALVLQTVCGQWRRPGQVVANPGVLTPPASWIAEAVPQPPFSGHGEPSRVRGLTETTLGMPTATAADEVLLPGPGRVRALLCMGSNPATAWPDQGKTGRALGALDLLVVVDPVLSATARYAHYVVAPTLSLETPGMTAATEALTSYGATAVGFDAPFAMYTPAVVAPPEGSDLVQEWELCYGLARRLGLGLTVAGRPVDMRRTPTDAELFELLTTDSRVPLATVMEHEHGALFPDDTIVVEPPPPGRDRPRLEVGHPTMLAELDAVAREDPDAPFAHHRPDEHPFRLTCRRLVPFKNSSGQHLPGLTRGSRHNPAFMHPDDLASLGLRSGDTALISSTRATVRAIVTAAPDVLAGTVSMAHGFGGPPPVGDPDEPDPDADVAAVGTSTSRLLTDEAGYDLRTGQPLMTAVPVSVRPLAQPEPER